MFRGIGRTTRMLEEAKKVEGKVLIVAHNARYARILAKEVPGSEGVGVHQVETLIGLGSGWNVYVDHWVKELCWDWDLRDIVKVMQMLERLK